MKRLEEQFLKLEVNMTDKVNDPSYISFLNLPQLQNLSIMRN